MNRFLNRIVIAFIYLLCFEQAQGQGMHFSQFFNAPMLLNPANTALMPDHDYRVGMNYRKQWGSVPVPYTTTSVFADCQLMRNKNLTNWLGLGLAVWNDKAGLGELSLTRVEGFVAYHVQLGESSMISAGLSLASVQRTVDFNKLSFDRQWDGFMFNGGLPSGESDYVMKTNFSDIGAGINYAYFPNEFTYLKVGFGLAHLTQPKETFYNQENKLGLRPTANVDLLLQLSRSVILNPSIYYTEQKSAREALIGTLLQVDVSNNDADDMQLILGAFNRVNESVVGNVGLSINDLRIMSSYDFTISSLGQAIKGRGAFELSIIYNGYYNSFSRGRRSYNCPRF